MRIFSWVQTKLNGNPEKKKSDIGSCSSRSSIPDVRKDEFSDWPQSLLTIGTLGNIEGKEDRERRNPTENPRSSRGPSSDFTLEEVIKLQKELTKLLKQKPKSSTDGPERGGERANLPLNRFLNCPSSLEVDRRDCVRIPNDLDGRENDGDLSPDSKIILNKAKDILADKHNAVKQRSLKFLLKKMFVCRGGFTPTPSFRDSLLESRMEKLMRIILHKKIYPQSSNALSGKKYLEKKTMEQIGFNDQQQENEEDKCKWVKTDSEYIVLEI